jgi:hypothetical protein
MHNWTLEASPALYGELLEDGNLLTSGHLTDGPLKEFRGAGGFLVEYDWAGREVWRFQDSYLHHAFERLPNGNTLVLKWEPVPKELAREVGGGIPASELNGQMYGDVLQEINRRGKVIWEWKAYEHLDPKEQTICPLCSRSQWTEANAVDVLPDGDIVIGFTRINTICVVERATGKIRWKWGAGELAHPNDVNALENGNLLLFDNGTHCIGIAASYSRILEIDPRSGKMIWEYKARPWQGLYSAFMSSCQRLANGNTLICEAMEGKIWEVTADGHVAWEYLNPADPIHHDRYGSNRYIPKALRYGTDFVGFDGRL